MNPSGTRDLALLPKAHLHVHLEAAVRPVTVEELARRDGRVAPVLPYQGGFGGFAELFLSMIGVLTEPGALERVIFEAAEDARADGVMVLELGVSPQFYADAFGSEDAVLGLLCDAARSASERTGVEVGLMVTLDRTGTPAAAEATATIAARFAGLGVVSLGLANNEVGYPAAPFAAAFAIARAAGLLSTPHAGELVGAASVREALDVLGANRIQHGVRAIEDPSLLARLAESDVCLDICPTSNLRLGVVPDLASHPLPRLLEAGVDCSLNADDPTLFGVSILDEYGLCRDGLGLSDAQLAACARSSIEHSAASSATRTAALAGIARWLDESPQEPSGSPIDARAEAGRNTP